MKISMEIKDGKIILTDEQTELSTQTKHTDNFTSGTNVDFIKTYEIELENKVKKIKEEIKQEKINEKEDTKKEFMNVISTESVLDKKGKTKNPNRFNTGSLKITMSTIDRPDIDQIADIDKDIPGYDRIRVFDSMERKCDVTIINDGYKTSNENEVIEKDSDAIYFIVNRTGIEPEEETWSQAELMIYPGEAWKIYDVYELRIRSEMQGTRYRITEDNTIIGSTIRSVM